MKPITKDKIGWGFVATGRIAHDFANCLEALDDCYIAAVGSRSVEGAKKFTDIHGGKPYGSYEEMMDDPDVDVVYIATPHMVHEENVIMAAKHGKNILCEKPFSINRPQAERMYAAAEEAGVFIMDGMWSRFFPVWQEVRRIVESGELGKFISIDAATCWGAPRGPEGFPPDDRRIDINLAGGALLDAGIYVLAALDVAVGGLKEMPEKVFSTMRFETSGVDSDTDMLIELPDGATAHLVCSLHRRNHEATLYFENGKIYIPGHRNPRSLTVTRRIPRADKTASAYAHIYEQTETKTIEMPYIKSGFQFEAEAVHDCLRKGLRYHPWVLPEQTLTLIGICDKIRAEHGFVYPFE